MQKKLILLTFATVLFSLASAYAYDNGDFQVWNTDVEEFKVNKDWKIALEEEFRWGNNAQQFYYQHYDLGAMYSLNKYWSVGGGYRQVYELKSNTFKAENEPYLVATLFLDKNGFVFDSRNRLEYRNFDYQEDSWRYRNKMTLKFPWKFTRMQIQPYVSDEVFYGFGSANQFNQNRAFVGLGMNLTKNLKGEVYYMLQSTRNGGVWTDVNVLGAKFKIAL